MPAETDPSASPAPGPAATGPHVTGPAVAAVVARARAFAHDVIGPEAARWDASPHTAPAEIVAAAGQAGLNGLFVPRELGGEGLGPVGGAAVFEELAAADFGAAFALVVHNNHANFVARRGSARLVEAHLPELVAGREVGTFCLTEPQGGTDAAAITTRARPDGEGGWVIDGAKAWISNATCATSLNLFAQTDPALGHRGIAAFLVDTATPGVGRDAPYPMLGCGALGAGGFRFERVRVGADRLFVGPGEAFRAAMGGIDLARVLVAAMCAGMLGAAVEVGVARTKARSSFGVALAEHQGLRWKMADVATAAFTARTAAHAAAAAVEAGAPGAAVAAAHAKKHATAVALPALADAAQVLGAWGLHREDGHPLARHLAAAKVAQYLDGTTEVQNLVIGRALYGS